MYCNLLRNSLTPLGHLMPYPLLSAKILFKEDYIISRIQKCGKTVGLMNHCFWVWLLVKDLWHLVRNNGPSCTWHVACIGRCDICLVEQWKLVEPSGRDPCIKGVCIRHKALLLALAVGIFCTVNVIESWLVELLFVGLISSRPCPVALAFYFCISIS